MTRKALEDPRFTTLGNPTLRPPGATPPWFTEALATPHDTGAVEVDGATVSYRAWGRPGDPVVVLVHVPSSHRALTTTGVRPPTALLV